jgi:hypothetical protein
MGDGEWGMGGWEMGMEFGLVRGRCEDGGCVSEC